jgi:hypothetical protein
VDDDRAREKLLLEEKQHILEQLRQPKQLLEKRQPEQLLEWWQPEHLLERWQPEHLPRRIDLSTR